MAELNPFLIYGIPPDTVEEAPNWRFVGEGEWLRSDGARLRRAATHWSILKGDAVTRLNSGVVGSYDDVAAMIHYDRVEACPGPAPAVGQIWSDGLTEFSVLVVERQADGVCIVVLSVPDDDGDFAAYSMRSDQAISLACLHGPGAPWCGADWYDRNSLAAQTPAGDAAES